MDMVMKQPKDELLRAYFYLHPEVDVKVSLGACLSEIFRITAPELPFEGKKMQIFFRLANKAYEFLPSMAGRAYTKALTILKTVSICDTHRIMLDEHMHDLVCEMFHLFLGGIRSDHPDEVHSNIEHIMSRTILDCEESDCLVVYLILILLYRLKKENRDANPVAFKLARNVFEKCDNIITLNILDAIKRSGLSVEQYDGIVASFFQNATGYSFVDNEVVEVDASKHAKGKSIDQQLDSKRSHSQPSPELRSKRLHDLPATASSPLSTNVSLKTKAHLGQASDRQRRKKHVKNSGEYVEEVAIDTSMPAEVSELGLENYVTTSESTPQDCPSRGKRLWKPNYRMKPEEGYTHIWMNKPRYRKEMTSSSSNAEMQLSYQQQGKKDVKNGEELSNSQSRSMLQGFRFGEVLNSLDQIRNAKAHDKDPHTLLSQLANVSSDRKRYVNAAGEASSSKGKELAIKEEEGMDTFVFGKDLRGDISTKALGSTSRSSSSKLKAKRRKSSNQNVTRDDAPAVQEVSENRPGPELVGRRISVLWPKEEDELFFEGTVTSYNPRNKKHWVYYDDGDWENLDLLNECWLYLG